MNALGFCASYSKPIAVFLAGVAAFLFDVFTVHGFLCAFWPWADTTGMIWPWATRLVWWFLVWQVAVAVEMRTVWREARLEVGSKRQLWLAAHVSLVHRLIRRARHHWGAVPNARTQWTRRQQPTTAAPVVVSSPSRPVQGTPVAEPKAA